MGIAYRINLSQTITGESGRMVMQRGHTASIVAVAMADDLLASADRDREVIVWHVGSREIVRCLRLPFDIATLTWDDDCLMAHGGTRQKKIVYQRPARPASDAANIGRDAADVTGNEIAMLDALEVAIEEDSLVFSEYGTEIRRIALDGVLRVEVEAMQRFAIVQNADGLHVFDASGSPRNNAIPACAADGDDWHDFYLTDAGSLFLVSQNGEIVLVDPMHERATSLCRLDARIGCVDAGTDGIAIGDLDGHVYFFDFKTNELSFKTPKAKPTFDTLLAIGPDASIFGARQTSFISLDLEPPTLAPQSPLPGVLTAACATAIDAHVVVALENGEVIRVHLASGDIAPIVKLDVPVVAIASTGVEFVAKTEEGKRQLLIFDGESIRSLSLKAEAVTFAVDADFGMLAVAYQSKVEFWRLDSLERVGSVAHKNVAHVVSMTARHFLLISADGAIVDVTLNDGEMTSVELLLTTEFDDAFLILSASPLSDKKLALIADVADGNLAFIRYDCGTQRVEKSWRLGFDGIELAAVAESERCFYAVPGARAVRFVSHGMCYAPDDWLRTRPGRKMSR